MARRLHRFAARQIPVRQLLSPRMLARAAMVNLRRQLRTQAGRAPMLDGTRAG